MLIIALKIASVSIAITIAITMTALMAYTVRFIRKNTSKTLIK